MNYRFSRDRLTHDSSLLYYRFNHDRLAHDSSLRYYRLSHDRLVHNCSIRYYWLSGGIHDGIERRVCRGFKFLLESDSISHANGGKEK